MSCGSCGQSSCSGCHSCNSCGSSGCNWGCGCSCAVSAGCNPAVCPQPATCGNILPANPTPYYVPSPQCQEDHCQQIIKNWYSAAICVNYAFNIPACGAPAILYFSDVKKLVVNSYLWHPTYGYFKIIAFDFSTGQVTILNQCQDGNAAAGTNVPACTCFIVTPIPVDVTTIGATCVAIDFTAPAVSDCIDITVTNVNNIEVGGQVTIGSGIYVVDAIVSPTIITICNEGEGITPGTPIIALDAQGNYQYCLSILGTNPCTKDIITSGVVIACAGGAPSPLGGATAGDLLQLQNATTDIGAYVSPGSIDIQNELVQLFNQSANKTGVITVGQTLTSNVASVTLTNASATRTMQVFVALEYFWQCTVLATNKEAVYGITLELQVNGGGYGVIRQFGDGYFIASALTIADNYNIAHVASVAPGASHDIDVRFSIVNITSGVSMDFTGGGNSGMKAQITGIAIAV